MEQKNENPTKRNRHRKKQLFKNILHQMEFYFSDSNLAKDRFLSQLISENPSVELEVFLRFNKIRKLTENIEDIRKAVQKSEMLQLSDDKSRISRRTPITIKEDIDDCTIYVERLNSDATHEWLTSLFSEFGKVTYVSIPKYKNNNMVKGFAFIEFEDIQAVENTVKFFEKIGGKIPSHMEGQSLCSIVTYEGNEKEDKPDEESKEAKVNTEDAVAKRKHSQLTDCNDDLASNKKPKLEENKELTNGDDDQKVDEKKKKKKNKNKSSIEELGLQILTKKEWKKMRNTYLNLQRKKMKELKSYLSKQRFSKAKEPKPNTQANNMQKEQSSAKVNKVNCNIDYKPGLIVRINLSEPLQSSKTLKNKLKSFFPDIQYVDTCASIENDEVFLRFSEVEHAKKFCSSDFDEGDCCILDGVEEKKYWNKISADRENKLSRNVKRQRGRDKLLKKAEKVMAQHVRFDEI